MRRRLSRKVERLNDAAHSHMFQATPVGAVAAGSVVMLVSSIIVYAGPINGAPPAEGRNVLLNPADFAKFKKYAESRKH